MSVDSHRRVLIVEDDREIREMLGRLLRQRGLTVDEAPGGQKAIDLIAEHHYSVVLLDLLMPQPDGFAVLESLDGRSPQALPVVLVLSGAERPVLDSLDSQRIHGIIRKPFDGDELASLVVACAEVRSRGSFGMMAMAMISSTRLIDFLN